MHTEKRGKTLWLGLLTALLLPTLACNFPRLNEPGGGQPGRIPAEALRQTLAVQSNQSKLETTQSTSQPAPPTPILPDATTTSQTGNGGTGGIDPGTQEAPLQFNYTAQAGDTLASVALRFGVEVAQISSPDTLSTNAYLAPGQALVIPNLLGSPPFNVPVLPDSEVIDSPSTVGFDIQAYVSQAGGYLGTYQEEVDGQVLSGGEIIERLARENASNPRLLLAFLEYRSHWLLSPTPDPATLDYPIGFHAQGDSGLYKELVIAIKELTVGYYGWRSGSVLDLKFPDDQHGRLGPGLNAGSAGVMRLFSKFYREADWQRAIYGPQGFLQLYEQLFGDPWQRAAQIEPLIIPGLGMPPVELPFEAGQSWSFSGGPHLAWNTGSPRGAIDFSPVTGAKPCAPSPAWVASSADGVITRSVNGAVALDLDGDGYEQTGWVLVYLHVAELDRIPAGTSVRMGDRLGHPSCERGNATGTHVHVTRKYNGEWLPTNSPVAFILSGWVVQDGSRDYLGTLNRDGVSIQANPSGTRSSIITR